MENPQDIVKSNFERYNRKLVFQDSILIVSLLFICANYFLVVESNYDSSKKLANSEQKIQTYISTIAKYKNKISSIVPDSAKSVISLKESDFQNEKAIEKLNPYLETNKQNDTVKKHISELRTAINKKDTLLSKVEDLKKKVAESKDALSIVKILLFINDSTAHFALFPSIVVLIILIYFDLTRKYLLNLLSRTLRIQKEKISFNDFYEYPINYSIWLTPIPHKSTYSVEQSELLNVLGIKNVHRSYKNVMSITFILLICLQLRLYFIELRTNKEILNFYSWLSLLICIITIILAYLWLSQKSIPDNYNSEVVKNIGLKRRDFILLTCTILPTTILAIYFPSLEYFGYSPKSSKLYNQIYNNPRFVSKRKLQPASEELILEKQCNSLISLKKYNSCISILFAAIKEKTSSSKEPADRNVVRLFDFLIKVLLVMIYRKEEQKYESTYNMLTHILLKSKDPTLLKRVKIWSNPNYKWIHVLKDKKCIIIWNNCVLS